MQVFLNKSFVALATVLAVQLQLASATIEAYFCNDAGFITDCARWSSLIPYQCYTLDAAHQNSISSFAPSAGVTCLLFTDNHCKQGCIYMYFPGAETLNLADGFGGQDCNDHINSFMCWK